MARSIPRKEYEGGLWFGSGSTDDICLRSSSDIEFSVASTAQINDGKSTYMSRP